MKALVLSLAVLMSSVASAQPARPAAPAKPQVSAIPEQQLQSLLAAIKKESFGDGKLRVLGSTAPNQYFQVPQVLRILQGFTFGVDKLDAVRMLWPRVLDRDNAAQLYKAFAFQREKDQLGQIIGK
jgi:hypothetical protein